MFRITNNDITISRGETAYYKSFVIDKYGVPFRLFQNIDGSNIIKCQLTIKDSLYRKANKVVAIFELDLSNRIKFDDSSIIELDISPEIPWGDVSIEGAVEHQLYSKKETNGSLSYGVFNGISFQEYFFEIGYIFDSSSTKNFEPKKYLYDINVISGKLNDSNEFITTNVIVLLDPHAFVVEGNLAT